MLAGNFLRLIGSGALTVAMDRSGRFSDRGTAYLSKAQQFRDPWLFKQEPDVS